MRLKRPAALWFRWDPPREKPKSADPPAAGRVKRSA